MKKLLLFLSLAFRFNAFSQVPSHVTTSGSAPFDPNYNPALDTISGEFKNGGFLPKADMGAQVGPVIRNSKGETKTTYSDGTIVIKDETGKVISTTPGTASTSKAQTGTTVAVSKGIKYENDAALYADPNWQINVKSGRAYVKGPNGKYYRANYVPGQPPKEAFDDNLGKYKDEYANLYAEMADPGVQKALYDNYKKHIDKVKDPALRAALQKRTKEDVVSDFLKMQKHNYTLQAKNIDFSTDEWKNKNNPQAAYEKYITQAGLTPLNAVETASAQAAYAGFVDASKDPKSKALFKGVVPIMKGVADESFLTDNSKVSAPDAIYGNTTAGELAHPTGIQLGDEYKDDEVAADTPDDVTSKHLDTAANKYTGYPAYWAQDVIKTAGTASTTKAEIGTIIIVKKDPNN